MTNFNFLKQRKLIIFGLGIIGFFLFLVFLTSGENETELPEEIETNSQQKKLRVSSTQDLIPEDKAWRYQANQQFEKQAQQQLESQKELLDKLDQFQAQIDHLKAEKEEMQTNPILSDLNLRGKEPMGFSQVEAPVIQIQPIQHHKLKLTQKEKPIFNKKTFKTTDTIIPATTFVKATLLNGVDAATAIVSSDDPIPVMLKLRDDGFIPRKLRSDLKGCHILAAAKGNLSAERAYMRLERLVCTEISTKEIIETDVSGYVVGPDGKNGIRGKVVSKEGKYLGRAAVGGVLSGFASVLNPDNAYRAPGNAIFKRESKQGKGDLFKTGLSGSVSNSTDRLAQYYIDRAEQIQPVISIPGGVDVEIVFTSSVDIGSSNVKQKIASERDKRREMQIDQMNLWHGE